MAYKVETNFQKTLFAEFFFLNEMEGGGGDCDAASRWIAPISF